MIFKSENMTQASGSIAGVTYSHAKGGVLYRRARAIPVNPQTGYQTEVRSLLTGLSSSWSSLLTQTQRDSWDLYASNVTVVNALGDNVNLSGQNWYIGANVPRGQSAVKLASGLNLVTSAPTIFDRGDFTTPVCTCSDATGLQTVFDNAEDWANEDDAAMLIFQGQPRNASRKFFKGPYRLVGVILGDSVTPPTSPNLVAAATLTAEGFTVTAGQRLSVAVAVIRADGRYSTRRNLNDIIVT